MVERRQNKHKNNAAVCAVMLSGLLSSFCDSKDDPEARPLPMPMPVPVPGEAPAAAAPGAPTPAAEPGSPSQPGSPQLGRSPTGTQAGTKTDAGAKDAGKTAKFDAGLKMPSQDCLNKCNAEVTRCLTPAEGGLPNAAACQQGLTRCMDGCK